MITLACPYCRAVDHSTAEACPRVKSIEYHAMHSGYKRIEFFDAPMDVRAVTVADTQGCIPELKQ